MPCTVPSIMERLAHDCTSYKYVYIVRVLYISIVHMVRCTLCTKGSPTMLYVRCTVLCTMSNCTARCTWYITATMERHDSTYMLHEYIHSTSYIVHVDSPCTLYDVHTLYIVHVLVHTCIQYLVAAIALLFTMMYIQVRLHSRPSSTRLVYVYIVLVPCTLYYVHRTVHTCTMPGCVHARVLLQVV